MLIRAYGGGMTIGSGPAKHESGICTEQASRPVLVCGRYRTDSFDVLLWPL